MKSEKKNIIFLKEKKYYLVRTFRVKFPEQTEILSKMKSISSCSIF
jgi:hypothetical protein